MNTSCLGLPSLSASSQSSKSSGFPPDPHPAPLPGKSLKAISWDNHRADLTCLFLRESLFFVAFLLCYEPILHTYLFIGCFRWRISPVSASSLWRCETRMCWRNDHKMFVLPSCGSTYQHTNLVTVDMFLNLIQNCFHLVRLPNLCFCLYRHDINERAEHEMINYKDQLLNRNKISKIALGLLINVHLTSCFTGILNNYF